MEILRTIFRSIWRAIMPLPPVYNEITDPEVAPESPVTSSLITRLRDNALAVAGGDSAAPHLAPSRKAIFTSDGNFVVPAGVYRMRVHIWGGGAGGGGSGDTSDAGQGGAGGYLDVVLQVSPTDTYVITIGEGGDGGANLNNGSNGDDTVVAFGAEELVAIGGNGGGSGEALGGGAGGSGGGTLIPGAPAAFVYVGAATDQYSATGQAGAPQRQYVGALTPLHGGLNQGSGGMGAVQASGAAGTDGEDGLVIIEY
jgi:hypothetical protein